jgi:hypothetical protein
LKTKEAFLRFKGHSIKQPQRCVSTIWRHIQINKLLLFKMRPRRMPNKILGLKGRGAACRKNIFCGSPPEEISPQILMIAHSLIGEGSIGGFPQSFSDAWTP